MNIVYLDSTKSDLAWYRTYYSSIFPAGAGRAAAGYMKAITTLMDHPLVGRIVADGSTRRFPIRHTPFSIFYRVTEQSIEVVRIWDQRADHKKMELHEEAIPFI